MNFGMTSLVCLKKIFISASVLKDFFPHRIKNSSIKFFLLVLQILLCCLIACIISVDILTFFSFFLHNLPSPPWLLLRFLFTIGFEQFGYDVAWLSFLYGSFAWSSFVFLNMWFYSFHQIWKFISIMSNVFLLISSHFRYSHFTYLRSLKFFHSSLMLYF